MNLRRRNKVNPNFNMSSMTDIVFLLLIFFMLTSTLVSPNALKLLLPSSKSKILEKQTISVSINKDIHFYKREMPPIQRTISFLTSVLYLFKSIKTTRQSIRYTKRSI